MFLFSAESKYISEGFPKRIAEAANGKYYYLPKASDSSVVAATSSEMAMERELS